MQAFIKGDSMKVEKLLARLNTTPLSLWKQRLKHIKTLHPPQKIMTESKE
jgi:hypothetical protein